MKAVIYARVSSTTDRQNTDSQVIVLKDYAKANNIEIVDVCTDKISGASPIEEREGLLKCKEYIQNGKIDIVLVYSIDRIGRSVVDVFKVVEWLADNKVNAYFLDDNKFLLDDNGVITDYMLMMITLKSLVGKIEKNNIKNRLNRGREIYIKNNGVLGRKVGSTMTKEDREKKYKEVIKMLRKGLTVKQILTICKAENIKVGEATIWKLKKEFCPKND